MTRVSPYCPETREATLALFMANPSGNKTFAHTLGLTPSGANDRMARLMRYLGVGNRAQLYITTRERQHGPRPGYINIPALSPAQNLVASTLWLHYDKSDDALGRILGLSPQTVQSHLMSINRALGTHSRLEILAHIYQRLAPSQHK